MPDWVVAGDVGTAIGTLILAVATFAAVRSANRAARVAERAMLEAIRPLLLPSRPQDPAERIPYLDDYWVAVEGGHGAAEVKHGVIYLGLPLRNVGPGLAVLHGWLVDFGRQPGVPRRPDPDSFRRMIRDLYVPAGDFGFWLGTIRDPIDSQYAELAAAVAGETPFTVDLLYGDAEGGQRIISSFRFAPAGPGDWFAVSGLHWNLDRPDPR